LSNKEICFIEKKQGMPTKLNTISLPLKIFEKKLKNQEILAERNNFVPTIISNSFSSRLKIFQKIETQLKKNFGICIFNIVLFLVKEPS